MLFPERQWVKGGEVRPGAVPLGGAQVCRNQGSWQSGPQGVILAPPSLESPLPPSWDWSLGTTPRQVTGGLGGVARYGLQLGDRDREPPPAVVLVPRGCSEPHLPFLQHQGPIPPLGLGWRHGGGGAAGPAPLSSGLPRCSSAPALKGHPLPCSPGTGWQGVWSAWFHSYMGGGHRVA